MLCQGVSVLAIDPSTGCCRARTGSFYVLYPHQMTESPMTDKTLSERIAEFEVKRGVRANAGRNDVLFQAALADIKSAMTDGWSVRAIWEVLHSEGRITCSRSTFHRLVDRYIVSSDKSLGKPSHTQGT